MADTTSVTWIYPPHMEDGDWAEKSGNNRVVFQLSGISDGTGETDVTKVDLTDLKTPSGKVPAGTAIEYVEYVVNGITCKLEWDRAPHAEIITIDGSNSPSSGRIDWSRFGGKVNVGDDGTGDILLTTTNADNGDTYDITVCMRLKD